MMILGAVVAIVGTPAGAAPLTAMGDGGSSCAEWTAQTQAGQGSMQWALGYLSRAAYARGLDILKAPDAQTIQARLAAYCQAHPKANLNLATAALEIELVRQARGKR